METVKNDWIAITFELPPLDIMVEVQTISRTGDITFWETYFETPFIRQHVLLKWGITHWKLLNKQINGSKYHKQIIGKY